MKMKWIKVTERLPEKTGWYFVRKGSLKENAHKALHHMDVLKVEAKIPGYWSEIYEWLDESESPTTADASVLKEALVRIESLEVPEEEEFTFDPGDFIFQLKGIARKALTQYNTQSPSPSSGVGHLIDYLKKIEAICIRDAGNVDKMQEDFKAIFPVCQSALSDQSLPAPNGSQGEQGEINKLQEQNFELAKGVMELMKVQKILAKVSGLGILSHTLQQHEKAIDDLLEEYHNIKRSQSTLSDQSPSTIDESGLKEGEQRVPGTFTAPMYTAEELQKNFIRQTCEGYDNSNRALINQGDLKGWFEWLASLKIVKEHGLGIE